MSNEAPTTKRHPLYWLLSVVVPCLITSYFSYRTARVEADAKASAGYATLVASLNELRDEFASHVHEEQHRVGEVSGQISLLRDMITRLYNQQPRLKKPSGLEFESALAPPMLKNAESFAKDLPATLDQAAAARAK